MEQQYSSFVCNSGRGVKAVLQQWQQQQHNLHVLCYCSIIVVFQIHQKIEITILHTHFKNNNSPVSDERVQDI